MTQVLHPGKNRLKAAVVRIVLFLFGRAAQIVSKIDRDIRDEIARWPAGYVILYKVLPNGPRMALVRTPQGRLAHMGDRVSEADADLTVAVKNLESAFLIFTFRMGTNEAYAQNRLSVRGDVPTAMSQIRVLNRILAYMLPAFMVRRVTLKTPRIRPVKKHVYRGLIYLVGIPFGV